MWLLTSKSGCNSQYGRMTHEIDCFYELMIYVGIIAIIIASILNTFYILLTSVIHWIIPEIIINTILIINIIGISSLVIGSISLFIISFISYYS
jgi:vacuolar-type H+-ATPase subunit I/STV1